MPEINSVHLPGEKPDAFSALSPVVLNREIPSVHHIIHPYQVSPKKIEYNSQHN